MKRTVLFALLVVAALILSLIGVKVFLFGGGYAEEPSSAASDVQPVDSSGESLDGEDVGVDSQPTPSMNLDTSATPYSNGIASFVYDGTQLMWEEMPSDQEHGYPLTSFYLINSDEALPRVDILPAILEEPFSDSLTEAEWEEFARDLVLAYYTADERESINLSFKNAVVKVDGDSAKMYVAFTTELPDATQYSMSGAIRLVSSGKNAVITIASYKPGDELPHSLYELYMSASIVS